MKKEYCSPECSLYEALLNEVVLESASLEKMKVTNDNWY